jgi:S-adenosylmethionine decarboxylase
MKSLGRHLLTEFYSCDREILNDLDRIRKIMEESAITSGASIVKSVFHLFNPHGVSGVVVIAESHLAIHTWPEYGFTAVDIFTCGEEVDPWRAYRYLKEKLRAGSTSTVEILRGKIESDGEGLRHKPLEPQQEQYSPELSPSINKFDGELIQTSAERLDMSLRPELRPRGSSTCLSRKPSGLSADFDDLSRVE